MKKYSRYTVDTLSIEYLLQGDKVFTEALARGATTWKTIKRVAERLNEPHASAIKKWIKENEPEATRGRVPPKEGEARTYKVQQLQKGGGRFVRLPVDLISSDKGDTIEVIYGNDEIIVRRVVEAPAAKATPARKTKAAAKRTTIRRRSA